MFQQRRGTNCDKSMEMKLIDVVGELASFDSESTIYASEPWSPDCDAIVAAESGNTPRDPRTAQHEIFLGSVHSTRFLG